MWQTYIQCIYINIHAFIYIVCVCVSCSVMSSSSWTHGHLSTRLLCPCNSPVKNTGVSSHSLLQGIFLTQGLNLGFPHCRQILYHLSHQESPIYVFVCMWLSHAPHGGGTLPREGVDSSDHIGFILARCAEGIALCLHIFYASHIFFSFFLFFFFFLRLCYAAWRILGSPTRVQNHAPLHWECGGSITGPPRKSPHFRI